VKFNPIPIVLHAFTLLFVALKLTNHIDWSWWLVTATSWAPFSLGVLLLAIGGLLRYLALRNLTPEERRQVEAAERLDMLREAIKAGRVA